MLLRQKMTIYKLLFLLCCFAIYSIARTSSSSPDTVETSGHNDLADGIKYKPNWESLDSRPLPAWFDEYKFGIFIHWGVYSVPSFSSEWFWINWKSGSKPEIQDFMSKNYKPGFSYQDFARDFTAEFFNATQWSEIFEASGAKYVVLTSKHHEGYTLWPSMYSYSWNSMDVGPHKDLVGELSSAIRKNTKLKFGVYHSLYEWFNPMYTRDKNNNFTTDLFVTHKVIPEMKELISTYKPEVLWSDGDWEAPEEYWKSTDFLAWLYNESPVKDTIVTNDRWGINVSCHHGDFYNCQDRYNPGVLQKHKWENAMTIDKKSWGFRRNAPLADYFTLEELIKELVVTVSTGGNLLMNVGPTKDGIIHPIFEERLRGMGNWLKVNGEAIYKTKPWKLQNDTLTSDVWFTQGQNDNLYVIVLSWPKDNTVRLNKLVKTTSSSTVTILGSTELIKWKQASDFVEIILPLALRSGEPAWALKITNLQTN